METYKPWWWPRIIDDTHLDNLRKTDDEYSDYCDDELLEEFEDGREKGQFSVVWDHLGDAYEQYEELAKAFLDLVKETGKDRSDFIKKIKDNEEEI